MKFLIKYFLHSSYSNSSKAIRSPGVPQCRKMRSLVPRAILRGVIKAKATVYSISAANENIRNWFLIP